MTRRHDRPAGTGVPAPLRGNERPAPLRGDEGPALLRGDGGPAPLRGDEGAVAARCFQLAGQMRGGPVRDALLAMGRDYAARARDASRLAGRGPAEEGRAPPAGLLGRLFAFVTDFAAPLPAPPSSRRGAVPMAGDGAVRRAPAPASVAPAAVVSTAGAAEAVQPRTDAPRRGSRLFRISRPD